MISLTVSGLGALVAAIGSGVLLARCFRGPRGDLIAWSVALLGLLVSLGSQAIGHLAGFDATMFRAMEIGGQVIAPLALILALSEVAARSAAIRFCARLYIPALAIVAIVVLSLDQLTQASFSKAWPDPSAVYQVPPNYVLMFGIGPLTALITIIAVATVVLRSGLPGWNAALPAQLLGGAAALALAYPCLAQLVTYLTGVHVPVATAFSVLCAAAAALAWMAGVRTGELPLADLHSRRPGGLPMDGRPRPDRPYQDDRRYREDEPYRRPEAVGAWASRNEPDLGQADFATGDFATGDFAAGDFALAIRAGDFAPGGHADSEFAERDYRSGAGQPEFADDEFATGDFAAADMAGGGMAGGGMAGGGMAGGDGAAGLPPRGWQDLDDAADDDLGRRPRHEEPLDDLAGAGGAGERSRLFGQIAIYTLLEDRVEEFDHLTERVIAQVRSREPDTLVYIVHAVPSAPMQRILYEVYRDRRAYDRHLQQPYVQQFDADRRPYVLATNVIELGLQQAKVSPFPSVSDLFPEPGYDTGGFERPDYLRDYGRAPDQPGSGRGRR